MKCKGKGKGKGYGCGRELTIMKYGLCETCYGGFLVESPYGDEIIREITKRAKANMAREEKRELKAQKESLKGLRDYKKELQVLVNFIIRHMDYDKGCISCNHGWEGRWTRQRQAGHYFDTKSHDILRFNTFNIFCQCTICNDRLSANLDNYRKGVARHHGEDMMVYIDSLPDMYKGHVFEAVEIKYAITVAKEIKKGILSGRDYTREEVNDMLKLY